MTNPDHYEMIVVGSGEGGKYLAWHTARSGLRTAVIERQYIGGACPNTNCLPSKNEIWSAKVAHLVRHADEFGSLTGPAKVDMAKVYARKRAMVDELIAMHLEQFAASGAELVMGSGRFAAPRTIEVQMNDGGTRTLTGDRVVIGVGTHAAIPDVPGLARAAPLTNVEALDLDRLPEHLIVLGGGYIGLEMSQAYRRFGSAVTVIEAGPRVASREDADVGGAILDLMQSEGVTVRLGTELLGVEGRSGEAVSLRVRTAGRVETIEGSDILVAVGRVPNTTGLGLEHAGVTLDSRGFINVNDRLETGAPDVWAIGDCAGSPQFTHVSFDDFRVIRGNLAGGNLSTHGRVVPYCMYTDPPLGRVGLSEDEARRQGTTVRVATLPVATVLRSRTISETRGFLKVVVDAASDRILGFTMLGPEAGEVMAVVQVAMRAGMPYTELRDTVIAHPTMAEGLVSLLSKVPV